MANATAPALTALSVRVSTSQGMTNAITWFAYVEADCEAMTRSNWFAPNSLCNPFFMFFILDTFKLFQTFSEPAEGFVPAASFNIYLLCTQIVP
ncbi:MAG: hypothetical protein L0287_29440 [Anaerolineae bacterium]|nr:hypothetical protein [Anaerolineae bacterium]